MGVLTVKGDKFYLDGEPYTIISGSMHYFRVPREYWRDRLAKLKACGFNTVETYTCWNLHEKTEGNFDFTGMLDLGAYIDEAASFGLNVILRPGPYICAEWEMGGLPAWLLNYKDMAIRCLDEIFLSKVENYYRELLSVVVPRLSTHGGNVIMMQIENEYGSYGDDHEYMRRIADIYKKYGVDCLLFTSDGACDSMLQGGTLPEYLCTANFGSDPERNFAALESFRLGEPKMCTEYWCGWFDHWHEEHHVRDAKELAGLFQDMIDSGASLNFYMFHGGTNFGFMNGANYFDKYEPTVTSYDYNALLSEAGDMTPAYYEVQKIMKKRLGSLPDIEVKNSEKKAYGKVVLNEYCSLFDAIDSISSPVSVPAPEFTEDIGQYYGYTLYSTVIDGPRDENDLNIDAVHDRAVIFADGKFVGVRERTDRKDDIRLRVPRGEKLKLDILCENMGRVNYGPKLLDRKGIKGVRFGLQYHFGWNMYPMTMDDLSGIKFSPYSGTQEKYAGFFRGYLDIDSVPCDTFIELPCFTKGIVIINGFNLGRYFNPAGPQKTLYVPAPILKPGKNEIIVFESDLATNSEVIFSDAPILG